MLDALKENNFQFNKKFGQNFIFDSNLLSAIVNDAGVDSTTNVLEIGTGAGTLTKKTIRKSKKSGHLWNWQKFGANFIGKFKWSKKCWNSF